MQVGYDVNNPVLPPWLDHDNFPFGPYVSAGPGADINWDYVWALQGYTNHHPATAPNLQPFQMPLYDWQKQNARDGLDYNDRVPEGWTKSADGAHWMPPPPPTPIAVALTALDAAVAAVKKATTPTT